MCATDRPELCDAAEVIAKTLNESAAYAGVGVYGHTAASVRRMIRDKWKKLAPLAHSVHEQECQEAKKIEARELAELARLKAKYEC